jgi:hypothetical protein
MKMEMRLEATREECWIAVFQGHLFLEGEMRFMPDVILVICLMVCPFVVGRQVSFCDEQGGNPPAQAAPALTPQELQARIGKLILQLGNENWEMREAAQSALEEIGEPAREQLEAAKNDPDPEIADRVGHLLENLGRTKVTFEIVTTSGKPVAGKKVQIMFGRNLPPGGEADAEGRRRVEVGQTLSEEGTVTVEGLAPGRYDIEVTLEGRGREQTEMALKGGHRTCRLVFPDAGGVKGKVIDAKTKAPVARVIVRVMRGYSGSMDARVDEEGKFSFEDIAAGDYSFNIIDEGETGYNGSLEANNDVTVVAGETAEVTLEAVSADAQETVKMKIIGADGKPFSGEAQVSFEQMKRQKDGKYVSTGNWDFRPVECKEGDCDFGKRLPGKYDVMIKVPGCAERRFTEWEVKEGAGEAVEVRMAEGARLKVTVLGADGKPMVNAGVVAMEFKDEPEDAKPAQVGYRKQPSNAKTGNDGVASFDQLEAGKCAVRVMDGVPVQSDEMVVEVKPGEAATAAFDYSKLTLLRLHLVDAKTKEDLEISDMRSCNAFRERRRIICPACNGVHGGVLTEGEKARRPHIGGDRSYYPYLDETGCGTVALGESDAGDTVILRAEGYKPVRYEVKEMPAGKITDITLEAEPADSGTGALSAKILPGKGLELRDIGQVYVIPADDTDNSYVFRDFPDDTKKAKPDQNGVAGVSDIPQGPCYLAVCNNDDELIALFKSHIEKDKTAQTTLNIPAAGAIEGLLIDANGQPKPNDEVYLAPLLPTGVPAQTAALVREWKRLLPVAVTGNAGKFSFAKVPAGDHILINGKYSQCRVTVKEGATSNAELHIVKMVNATIAITAPPGEKPIEEPFVRICQVYPDGALLPVDELRVSTGATSYGRDFPAGKYIFLVGEISDRCGAVVPVEIGQDATSLEVQVSLPQGTCSIAGKIAVDPAVQSTRPKVLFAMGEKTFATAYAELDGSFKFSGLVPGKYKIFERRFTFDFLCINAKDYFPIKEITVEEGKTVEGVEIP